AARLGFGRDVVDSLAAVFERWDGSGVPRHLRGADIPLSVRIMHLAWDLALLYRVGGADLCVALARERAGGAFDPALVACMCADPGGILRVLETATPWLDVIAAEPGTARLLHRER